MKPQKFFYPILEALDQGCAMRVFWAFGLRCIGVLFALGGIYAFIEILRLSFKAQSGEYIVGGLLFGIAVLGTTALVIQVFFYRARCIDDLPDSRFTVIPIFSIIVRTIGEAYAIVASIIAIGGCLFLWIAKGNPLYLIPGLRAFLPSSPAEATFLGGLVFAGILLPVALAVLMLAYFISESIVVLADIATNMRILRDNWVPEESSAEAPEPLAPSIAPAPRRAGSAKNVQRQHAEHAQDAASPYYAEVNDQYAAELLRQPYQPSPHPAAMPAPVLRQEQYREPLPQLVQQAQQVQQPQTPPPPRELRRKIRIVQRCRNCAAELAPGHTNCRACGAPV